MNSIFQTPWQRIVSSTENLAASHEILAQKIETDVELPLRQFANQNREMKAVNSSTSNISSVARELSSAQKRLRRAVGEQTRPVPLSMELLGNGSRRHRTCLSNCNHLMSEGSITCAMSSHNSRPMRLIRSKEVVLVQNLVSTPCSRSKRETKSRCSPQR